MTETTAQPNPQVVAWMRGHLRKHPDARHGDLVHAYRRTHGVYQPPDWDALYAAEDAARKPLTVADIPAGQGAASLFIGPTVSGDLALWFKATGTDWTFIQWPTGPGDRPHHRALWEHLAATLPTVAATEETP